MIRSSAYQPWHADIPSGRHREAPWMSEATPSYGTRSNRAVTSYRVFDGTRIHQATNGLVAIFTFDLLLVSHTLNSRSAKNPIALD